MGEVKDDKGANKIPIRLKIGEKNFVIGTLSAGDRPQIMFDLVFEKEFELSHDWKSGSVYFIGYQTMDPCLYPSILSFYYFIICHISAKLVLCQFFSAMA